MCVGSPKPPKPEPLPIEPSIDDASISLARNIRKQQLVARQKGFLSLINTSQKGMLGGGSNTTSSAA